jgi:hypothetical protein
MTVDDPRCRCAGADGCGGVDTPAPVPGDPARFRHSAILGRMLDGVAQAEAFGARALAGLGTRATDDPAIALLSAAAGTAHVLGWTLNRLYLDGTLPATEDRAALTALTGLLGHEPRPAVSATTVLSFTLDDLAGAPTTATVPKGTKVATIPGPGELPVPFETDAEIEVRVGWNALRPLRAPAPSAVTVATTQIAVQQPAVDARVGDRLLVRSSVSGDDVTWVLARVTAVTAATAKSPTLLDLAGQKAVTAPATRTDPAPEGTVIVLGGRARAFGATAPDITFMPDAVRTARGEPRTDGLLPTEWADYVMSRSGTDAGGAVHLDGVHPEAAPGRVAVFETPGALPTPKIPGVIPGVIAAATPAPAITRISAVADTGRTDFGLSLSCTRITVEGVDLAAAIGFNDRVQTATIHLETARLTLVVPDADPVLPLTDPAVAQHPALPAESSADRLYVVGEVALPVGRRVVLTGRDAADTTTVVESATVAEARVNPATSSSVAATLLVFDGALIGRWQASSLQILGNSGSASQGEASAMGAETLGSGNPATPLPRFVLQRAPLAHVPAAGPKGYAPAIEVRVDDRTYALADTLYGEGPDSRRFHVAARGDGRSEVRFAGLLPSGTGNVTADYRTGGGTAGNLDAGRLTQAMTPVLGVRSVTNAVPAEGGSDAETLESIRVAAPKSIRTLDRAVALSDFEAFAESFRGVGKAAAVELRSGMRRVVVVTIATTTLEPPAAGSDVVDDLLAAVLATAPPGTRVRIEGFVDLPMTLEIALATDPALRRGEVEAAVRASLERDFGRPMRRFGEAVHRSQVLACVQGVAGVVAALLTGFSAPGVVVDGQGRLPCPGPVLTDTVFTPARLLSVAAADVGFTELAS